MPTLTTPTTVTFSIQIDQVLTLTNNFGAGRVTLSAQRGGDVVFDYTNDQLLNAPVFSSGSQGIVTITHLSGSLTYDVTSSAFGLTNVIGLSTANTTAAASANTAAIQAALNAGGLVQIVAPGTYYINKTLIVRSYTRIFTAPGVNIKLSAGSNCRMVNNWSAQESVPSTQISIGGSQAVFTEWGHTRAVGEQVYIEGCLGNTALNGLKTITAVSGVTWTVASTNTALTNSSTQWIHIARYFPLAGATFVRSSNVVTVAESGHARQIGDHVYITGIPVVTATFNGMAEITSVVKGVSWSFAQTAANETGTGTAQVLGDTGIQMDIAALDYDATANNFHELDAVNVTLGNIGNSTCSFHALIDGRSRSVQLFNAGMMRFPQSIAYNGKGTFQIESFCNQIFVGDVENHGGTDDVIAWGITNPAATFGETACPSGQGNMGVFYVTRAYARCTQAGTGFKIFCMDGRDLGSITCEHFTGPSGSLTIGDPAVGTTATVQQIIFRRIDVVPANSSTNQIIVTSWSNISLISLSNIFDKTTVGGTGRLLTIPSASAMTIGTLNLDNIDSRVAQTNISMLVSGLSTITNLNVSNSLFTPGAANDIFRIQSTAVVGNFTATNIRVIASASFAANFIGTNSGGTIAYLQVENYRGNNRAVYSGGSSATKLQMQVTNCVVPAVFNDDGGTQSFDVYFSNLVQFPTGVNLFSPSGSGTIRIKGKGVSHGAGQFCQLTSGTFSASIDCPDAQIDLGASAAAPPARLVPIPGDQIWNTNAVGGGLYGRRAAGTWLNIY